MRKVLYSAVILLVLCSWNVNISNTFHKVQWLIGTWQMTTPQGNIYEMWQKTSNNELSGKSYMLKNKDTVVIETLKLVQEKDNLFYIPTVKRQNGGLPVRFSMETISDTGFVFKNLSHDFPQFITYKRIGKDSLIAEISGKQNGRERKERFPMLKVKW